MRRFQQGRVQEIAEVLRSIYGVQNFDEELFGTLVERTKVINLVQVEFVLQSGVEIIEIL